MPDHYLLNASTIWSCAIRAGMVDALRVASPPYHLLDKVRLFEVSLYPFCVNFIQRMSGSTMRMKTREERESLCMVPHRIWIRRVNP